MSTPAKPTDKIVADAKALVAAKTAQANTAAHTKALAIKEHARAEAAQAAAKERMFEVLRLNYYVISNYNDYLYAYNHRTPDAHGILPFIDPEDYERAPPTKEEWATLNDQQKLAQGSITTFNMP